MIVELCGVPGGGKSTLARGYTERYPQGSVLISLDMYSRWPTFWYGFLYALRHPVSFCWLMLFVVFYHARGLFWYSVHLAIRACAKYAMAEAQSTAVVIVDEGVVHVLCVLSGQRLSKNDMCRWITRVTPPDMLAIARTGDFHRFHNEHAHLHPRVMRGAPSLEEWEKVVREQVSHIEECARTRGMRVWAIPEKGVVSSGDIVEAFKAAI